ncbi:MAG: short chain dehydrogenase [Caulobacteraceae bacterium]|nr:short chain dehydrogenase [Caulobacteraceae bacterium]
MQTFRDGLLEGKAAFVAGGTRGINLGIAQRLRDMGAQVAVCGRDPDRAAQAAATLGGGSLGLACDVRDYAAVRAAMEEVVGKFGLLDIVVSGAAGNFMAAAKDMSANAFRTVVDIDLNGTFNVFRASYDLIRKPGASLIAISAGQADLPSAMQAHACAAKAGVNQVVRVLALEWGPDGVRVNGISPGPIAGTEGMARLVGDGPALQRMLAQVPLGRQGEVGEIGDAALFLCSDAAAYITGVILECDGGFQLRSGR